MAEEKEQQKWSIDGTKSILDAKKKAAKGSGISFRTYTEDVKTRLAKVEAKREEIKLLGAKKLLERQRAWGKLTARERMALLFDNQSFTEHGIFAESQAKDLGMKEYKTPADGIVTGFGEVGGRTICAYAQDYTVLAGSVGEGHVLKQANCFRWAADAKVPFVGIMDSAGARIHEMNPSQKGFAQIWQLHSIFSGVIPQITAVCGAGAAGQVYHTALTDFVIMTNKPSTNIWLGGPRLTAATTTSEDITNAGGADYHMRYTGLCDYIAEDDADALRIVKKFLSYCPSNCYEEPPYVQPTDSPSRREEALLDILPADPRRIYDMHKIIELIVDDGEFFEIKKDFARNAIVGFCRFDGYPCGVYAGNPQYLGGCLDPDSCDKVTRFVTFCDCFNIPLLYLVDTPAVVIGDEWERKGVTRHAAKLLHTTNNVTVPRVSILVRKAYGGTWPIFLFKPQATDFCYGWPTGECTPMGPDGAIAIMYDREIKALPIEERLAFSDAKKKEYFDLYVDPLKVAGNMRYDFLDDIIDPRRTREVIINAFRLGRRVKQRLIPIPQRKHSNRPV